MGLITPGLEPEQDTGFAPVGQVWQVLSKEGHDDGLNNRPTLVTHGASGLLPAPCPWVNTGSLVPCARSPCPLALEHPGRRRAPGALRIHPCPLLLEHPRRMQGPRCPAHAAPCPLPWSSWSEHRAPGALRTQPACPWSTWGEHRVPGTLRTQPLPPAPGAPGVTQGPWCPAHAALPAAPGAPGVNTGSWCPVHTARGRAISRQQFGATP